MNVTEAIAKRKSIRDYMDKPVRTDDLEKIVEAGQRAPNVGEFKISVIRNKALLRQIDDLTYDAMVNSGIEILQYRASLPGYRPLYGAPVLILLSGPAQNPYSTADVTLAAENIILQATHLGLGSCYIISPTLALNMPENRVLALESGMPDGYKLHCGVILGYAADENRFSTGKRTKRGLVSYID